MAKRKPPELSAPLKSVHVRLGAEAHAVLGAIADLDDKDIAEMARLILEETLLGRVHVLRLTAERYKRVGFSGITGDLKGLEG